MKRAKNATALTATTVQQQKMQLLPDLRLNVNGADNVSLQAQRQQIAVDVRRAYLDAQSAEQQLAAASAQLAAAQKAVDATHARYEVGAATLVELTVARAQAVQAASAVATAKYNLVQRQTVMDYYTGALDPQHVSLGS